MSPQVRSPVFRAIRLRAGSAQAVGGLAGVLRQFQSGRLYQYALVMLLGIFALLTWRLWPFFSGLMR